MIKEQIGYFKLYEAEELLFCVLLFTPCIFNVLLGLVFIKGVLYLGYWLFTAFIGLLAIQRRALLRFDQKQISWLFVWMSLFLFSILNNNGVLQNNGSLKVFLTWFFIILFSMLIIMQRNFNDKYILVSIMLLLFVQLVAGYYYWFFPQKLLAISSIFVANEDVWIKKFTDMVNSGYFMGLVTHYSTSGMYMSLGLILSSALILVEKMQSGETTKLKLFLVVAFAVALLLTGKRANILFSTCAFFAMYFIGYVRGNIKNKIKQILVIFLLGVVICAFISQISIFQESIARFFVTGDLDQVSTGRVSGLWIPALRAFSENPFLGIGWNQFRYQFPQMQGIYYINNDCHNIYIQLLCENGIIGFCIFAFVMLYTFFLICKIVSKEKNKKYSSCLPQLMFALGYQVFFLLYGLTGNPLYDIQCLYPYIVSCALTYKYSG